MDEDIEIYSSGTMAQKNYHSFRKMQFKICEKYMEMIFQKHDTTNIKGLCLKLCCFWESLNYSLKVYNIKNNNR